jgi:hypothetical protein
MESGNGDIVVTVKAKSIPELVDRLQKILGQYKSMQPAQTQQQEVDFPEHIKKIYPKYQDNPQSAAMLAVLHANHKGKANAVESLELAKEMMQMFPSLFIGKTEGKVSAGNVFSGNFLKKEGLINIEVRDDEGEYRVYWA